MFSVLDFFSFSGRLRRLEYIVKLFTLVVIAFALAIVIGPSLVHSKPTIGRAGGLGMLPLQIGFFGLFLWSYTALAAQRIRDAGFRPGLWLGGYIVLCLAYALIVPAAHLQPELRSKMRTVWDAIGCVAWAIVIVWPSRGSPNSDGAEPAAIDHTPFPSPPQAQSSGGFGRRGEPTR
jgi:uncharacterized membrane protein YhaH (DUF805 family)